MTKSKIEADRVLCNFLRSNLTDVNSSRSGGWIFPDFPRMKDLGNASFPRIGITIIDESSDSLGIYDDNQWETITFQIDIVAKKGQKYDVTTTDEAMGTMVSTVNSNRFVYVAVPNSVTNIKHNTVAYGTVTMKDTDADFTAPGSLAADNVEWSFSTGNLNFNSTDVAADVGEAITSTSVTTLEGKKLCQYLARKVVSAIRTGWRTDTTLNGLFYPMKISNTPVPIDEDLSVYRQMVEYQFRAYNVGEGL